MEMETKAKFHERSVVSIGSNIRPRFEYLQRAVDMFRECDGIEVIAVSRVYETPPVSEEGETYDGDFLNACIVCDIFLSPVEFMAACHEIERLNGRDRSMEQEKGNRNRTLDCDIIFYGDQKTENGQLVIPHPLWPVREFILKPLADVSDQLTEWQRKSMEEVVGGIESGEGEAVMLERELK